ncbi:hypothetical protein C8J56DRAFT_1039307 [Mycena floridula]|nr:hypothetical protein C8J56DRAFT_1039307 [Mycena floridula]
MSAEAALEHSLIKSMSQTMGACLVGSYLSTAFYGVTLLQTYQYFSRFWGRDRIYLPILVTILTLLDTFAVISNMTSMWFYLIKNYGNPVAILTIDWSWMSSIISTAIVGFIVQAFYSYRVWILGGRRLLLPALLIFLALASLMLAIVYMVLLVKNGSLFYIPRVTFLSTSALACSFVADLIIATSVTTYLMKSRQQGFRQTNGILRKLVIYTINTGIITVICSLITMLLGQFKSNTFYNVIFYLTLSKCYINSMLAFLNARDSIGSTSNTVSVGLDPLRSTRAPTRDIISDASPRDNIFALKSSQDGKSYNNVGSIKFSRPDKSIIV